MRFFKAFSIIHRRTKSATFVSGPPFDHLASTRLSSSSYGPIPANRHSDIPVRSIFDMVTSIIPSIPPQFNHLADSSPSFWHPRRQSGRSSMTSFQSDTYKDNSRMKEASIFWSHEHSKLRSILNNCHADLVAERQKTLVLQRKADLDAQIITDLRKRLAQHTAKAESTCQNYASAPPIIAITPASPVSTSPAMKPPSMEEYSNALRLTLATRKELRDQKKITKFWKRTASTAGSDIITPSVSTISSIQESIPAERQTALRELVMRRGLTGLIKSPLSESPCVKASCTPEANLPPLSFEVVLPPTMSSLTSSLSRSSVDSRLPPLASESFKAEMNLVFGLHETSKLLPLSLNLKSRHHSDPTSIPEISKNSPPTKAPSLKVHNPCTTSPAFVNQGLSTLPKSATEVGQSDEVDHCSVYDQTFPVGLDSWSSSVMHLSTIPSGSSQTFAQEPPAHNSHLLSPSVKLAVKECTPRRSWHHYTLTKSSKPNQTIEMVVHPTTKQVAGKTDPTGNENRQLTLPVQKGHSRLPVPTFTRTVC